MSRVRRRLEKLERRPTAAPAQELGSTAREIREIDREIRRLKAEIAEARASMSPEELAVFRREGEELDRVLASFTNLDDQIRWLEAEIQKEQEASFEHQE